MTLSRREFVFGVAATAVVLRPGRPRPTKPPKPSPTPTPSPTAMSGLGRSPLGVSPLGG